MFKWTDKNGKEYVYTGHFNFKNQFHGDGTIFYIQACWLIPMAPTLDPSLMAVKTGMVSTSSTADYATKENTRRERRRARVLSTTSTTPSHTRESSIMICLMGKASSMTAQVLGMKPPGSKASTAPSSDQHVIHSSIILIYHICLPYPSLACYAL